LWLDFERWYVGMVVPDGGVGDLPGTVEQLDAEIPKALSAECIETLCHMGDEVVSMLVISVVWHSSSGGLTSSSLECPVFAPLIALTASTL
jgi:hypothetical protein